MSDWKEFSIGEIADPADRYSFSGGPFGSNLKSEEYTEGGVRIIQLQNIGDGHFKDNYKIYTSKEKADELLSCNIYPGEIILSKMGDPVARATLIPDSEERYLMASDGIRLKVDTARFDSVFILNAINSPQFRSSAEAVSVGSTRKRIGLTTLKGLTIYAPPLPEQKKIAEILSGIDRAIAKLIYKSQKLDALQASLTEEFVQELQGKMDLAELQEYAEVRTGVAKNAKSEGDMTEMPYMRVANVQDGYLDLSEIKTISIDRGRIQRYLLQAGDVLINEGGDLDKVGRGVIWRGVIKECLHQNHVFAVRCSERLTPEFLSLLLKSAYSKNYFLGCAKQTTNLASINSTQLKQFPIPVPDLRSQEQFISHITSVKELNSAITNEISGLEATKKAVAQDLLSGHKRVSI